MFYYAFDRSIENDLKAMERGAKFNNFVSRILRKAIAAVKAKGNKALTPEEAFAAIKRSGGGGTGMKGLSIKEAIELLRKYRAVVAPAKRKSRKQAKPDADVPAATTDDNSRRDSLGKKARQRQRDRRNKPAARTRDMRQVAETYSDAIQEIRSDASEDKFNKLVEKLIK